jgi:hypothetical protein
MPAIPAVCAVRGLGLAFVVVVGGALVASLAPSERRGEGLGIYGVVVSRVPLNTQISKDGLRWGGCSPAATWPQAPIGRVWDCGSIWLLATAASRAAADLSTSTGR